MYSRTNDNSAKEPKSAKTIERLLSDWKEIEREPFPLIQVHVNEEDFFEWHIILSPPAKVDKFTTHPLQGCKFHGIMRFSNAYPMVPPRISLSTYFPHPNVFGEYICLDMLQHDTTRFHRQLARDPNSCSTYTGGWSSAYTAFSILMQLQAFLFDLRVPQSGNYIKKQEFDPEFILKARDEANVFQCKTCKHNMKQAQETGLPQTQAVQRFSAYKGGPKITNLPQEVLCHIFDFVFSHKDIFALSRACKLFRTVIARFHVITRKELLCFYSKKPFTDVVLGVGIHVEHHPNGTGVKSVSSPFDLLSQEAYKDGLRESVWGQPFQYWMPLLLGGEHGRKAAPLLPHAISAFWPGVSFHPLMVLELFPKLMNNMVVHLVKEEVGDALMMSEKSLQGYCSFHHILLHMASQYPIIQQQAEFRLSEFMSHSSKRVKLVAPDLGELLVLLCLSSNYRWENVAKEFLSESFDRNVLWLLDKRSGDHPELCYLESYPVSTYRMEVSFKSTLVSRRLLMFQVAFLKLVGRPAGKTLGDILNGYRGSYGMPSQQAINKLHQTCKDIFAIQNWNEFYSALGLPTPSAEEITSALREAVRRSEAKGYHCDRTNPAEIVAWRKKVDAEFALLDETPLARPEEPPATEQFKVQLKNLSFSTHKEDIRNLAIQFGRVLFVELNRGEGSLVYDNKNSAETASQYLDGVTLYGRAIQTGPVYKPGEKPEAIKKSGLSLQRTKLPPMFATPVITEEPANPSRVRPVFRSNLGARRTLGTRQNSNLARTLTKQPVPEKQNSFVSPNMYRYLQEEK